MSEMLTQCPGCTGSKNYRFSLCAECFENFGRDVERWPEWLQFLVRDNARITRQDAMLQECEISEADLGCTIEELAEYWQGDSWGSQ